MDPINVLRATTSPARANTALPAAPEAPAPQDSTTITFDAAARSLFEKSGSSPTSTVAWSQGKSGLGAPALTSRGPCLVQGNELTCFDPEGAHQWTYAADSELSPPAAAPDGTSTYACSSNGMLHAVDVNGNKRWTLALPVDSLRPPTVAPNGTVFVAGNDGKVHAVSPDGSPLWSKKIKPWYDLNPSPDVYGNAVATPDNGVIVANCKKYLVKFDGKGHKAWRRGVRGEITQDPAVDARGNVAYGAYFSTLVMLDRKGREKWTHEMPARISSTPGFGPDGSVCAADDRGTVLRLDEDGEVQSVFDAGDRVVSQPVVAPDGTVFASTWLNCTVYAIPPGGGTEKWKATLGGLSVSPPRLAQDGTLYLSSVGGSLVALRDRPPAKTVQEVIQEAVASSAEAPSGSPPRVETVDGWVVIGGVRVPMRSSE